MPYRTSSGESLEHAQLVIDAQDTRQVVGKLVVRHRGDARREAEAGKQLEEPCDGVRVSTEPTEGQLVCTEQ